MPNWCDNNVTIHGTKEKIEEIHQVVTNYLNNSTDSVETKMKTKGFLGYCLPEPDYKTTPVASTYPFIDAQHASTEEEKKKALENKPTIRKDSWWDWRIQNWGTKWEVEADESTKYEDGDIEISLYFMSAWSPPIDAYNALLKQEGIKKIEANFYEPGMDFAGTYKNGDVCNIAISEITKEDLEKNPMVKELNECFEIYQHITGE